MSLPLFDDEETGQWTRGDSLLGDGTTAEPLAEQTRERRISLELAPDAQRSESAESEESAASVDTQWRREVRHAVTTLEGLERTLKLTAAERAGVERAIAGDPKDVQIMYGVGGERYLPELLLPWLPGYENSSPVRIGNAAYKQLQLDVFGEIADAMFQALKAGMEPSKRGQAVRPVILDYLAAAWREPDGGIWEVRGGPQHFVHSKVMAWVAFDRAAHELEVQVFNDTGRQWREIADGTAVHVDARGLTETRL